MLPFLESYRPKQSNQRGTANQNLKRVLPALFYKTDCISVCLVFVFSAFIALNKNRMHFIDPYD